MKTFRDKIVIVTGGASGIGRSISIYLAKKGARIIITDRNLQGAQDTADRIIANGGYGNAYHVDVTSPAGGNTRLEKKAPVYGL